MKLLGLFLTVCILGSAVAHPGWLSSLTSTVSDTGNVLRQTAVNTAKATTNVAKATTSLAVDATKASTNMAVNAAKTTTNIAINAAGTAKNITVSTAMAGVNMVKDLPMSAVNTGLGFLISQIKGIVTKSGKHVMSIPDISQKAGPISFNATSGYFKDLNTLVQDGRANISMSGTTIKIKVPLKLDAIDVGYDQFNVTLNLGIKKMNIGGGIKIHIKNDTFIVHLSLTPGITCALNVEKVEVAVLAGFNVDFTNIGKKSEWVLEKASNFIVNAIKGSIKSKVQSAVDSAIKTALKEDAAICSKFLG